jgi:hypothetical protein
MVSMRESYRRKFIVHLERDLAGEGFERSGRSFIRTDRSGNQIVIELHGALISDECASLRIPVGVLLGIKSEAEQSFRSHVSSVPSVGSAVWRHALGPDGWNGTYAWNICSVDEAADVARRVYESLRRELPRLLRLMDPDEMLAAAKQERWAFGWVVEGFLLADQGRVDEVEALFGMPDRDESDLVRVERMILRLARARTGP